MDTSNSAKKPKSFYNVALGLSGIACLILFISLVVLSNSSTRSSPISLSSFSSHYEVDPGPTRLDHIVFGLAGSGITWEHRREYIRLWWVLNATRGYVWLDKDPPTLPNNTYPPYRVSTPTDLVRNPQERIATVLKDSFELGLPDVRWFVMGDDDTVFFVDNLVSVLSKYDHRQMYYIGSNSEGVLPNLIHGFQTGFGGGGFAVSYALAYELVHIFDGCIERYRHLFGSDEKMGACVAELGVPITREPGFHQFDVTGDAYGLLSAHPVAPLVTLHHLDVVHSFFPGKSQLDSVKKLMQAYYTDPGLTVQQSFCYDYKHNFSLSLSWGYTAQLYPFLVPSRELSKPLETFGPWHGRKPYTFNTRPVNADPCQKPVIYYLDQAQAASDRKTTTTIYKKSVAGKTGKKCNQTVYKNAASVEHITVIAVKTDPGTWLKAPRRRCCEIMDTVTEKGGIWLMIRGCKHREALNM